MKNTTANSSSSVEDVASKKHSNESTIENNIVSFYQEIIHPGISRHELKDIFNQLSTPKISHLEGALTGKLYAVEGLRFLPTFARKSVHNLLQSRLSPWRGKYIDKGRGGNMVLDEGRDTQFGFYCVTEAEALDKSGPVIALDYDVPENPLLMWNILGELRELSPNRYLARMLYRVGDFQFTVLYFTLEK